MVVGVQKRVVERKAGVVGGVQLLKQRNRGLLRVGLELHQHRVNLGVEPEEQGFDFFVQGLVVEVADHAHDAGAVEPLAHGVRHPQAGHQGLVDEDGGAVGAELRRKAAAGDQVQAHRFHQVVVDQHRRYGQALPPPAHLRDVAPPQEAAQDAGRLHDAGQLLHLGQKGRLLTRRLAARIKAEHVRLVVAQRLALHKRQLRVDDHHGHDEQHRERELQHDQALPRPHVAGPGRQLAFQHGRRLEPRQVERGVAARQQPRTQRQGQAGPHQLRLPPQGQRLARQRAELREHELHQPHGHDQGQQGHHHGFGQVLPHQRGAARPQGLANAHFLDPPRGLGGEQVHEIDAGNHQNEPGNQGEQPHVGNAPPGGDAVFVGAVQVPC